MIARVAMALPMLRPVINQVMVQKGAGFGIGLFDEQYQAAGATLAKDTRAALDHADVLLKVRGPTAQEISALKSGAIVIAIYGFSARQNFLHKPAGFF